jgi:branched-chain amino acid transport system substrate-binding protein
MRGKKTPMSGRAVALLAALCLLAAACSGAKDDTAAPSVEAGGGPSSTLEAGGVDADGDGVDDVTGEAAAVDGQGQPVAGAATPPEPGTAAGSGAPAPGGGGSGGAPGGAAAPPDAALYQGAANTQGISDTEIRLCGHAALTYGPAFNATPDDFNVYYQAVNDAGGVHGRKIVATYENDNYEPATAVQAAEACKGKKPFFILGGIGFDQIPSVRNWAEANKELYFHHIATVRGSEGKRFSFTTQPSVEHVGRAFGQLTAARFKDKKIGVLYRNSEFWQPGFEAFRAVAKERGLNVVLAVPVEKNQANYTQALVSLRNAGAEVVWGWENTLALTQMVKQAKAQGYSPQWVAFPFNLTSQTLGDDALTPPMVGLASWPGYSKGDHGGTFAPYADDMRLFEAQYAKYRPNTDIGGVAGDLLWLNWIEQKRLVAMLEACGRDCTRNRLAGMLEAGYRATTSPTCPLDFSRGHDGSGGLVNVLETFRSPSGKVNWRSTALCRDGF